MTTIEVGVDWLSASCPIAAHGYQEWRNKCIDALQLVADDGNMPKEGALYGAAGVFCGGSFEGESHDRGYIRLTGPITSRLWAGVHHPDMNVSRFDIQMTWRENEPYRQLGEKANREANQFNDELPQNKRRDISFFSKNDGGYTCYVGSRSSDHFIRIYDKGKESRDANYNGCWRYECEYHNKPSLLLYRLLYGNREEAQKFIFRHINRYVRERGIKPPWDADSSEYNFSLPARDKTTIESNLLWLAAQVAPTVKRLTRAGYRDKVIAALGLLGPNESSFESDKGGI